jgi:hypothetical protein
MLNLLAQVAPKSHLAIDRMKININLKINLYDYSMTEEPMIKML